LSGKFAKIHKCKNLLPATAALWRGLQLTGFLLWRCDHGFSPATLLRGMWWSLYLYVPAHSKLLFTVALRPWLLSRAFSGGMCEKPPL
jgi:hypothetical protein